MKKVIIIGIVIAIVIGIVGVSTLQDDANNSTNTNEISTSDEIENEPKQFTVGLTESVGFSEYP